MHHYRHSEWGDGAAVRMPWRIGVALDADHALCQFRPRWPQDTAVINSPALITETGMSDASKARLRSSALQLTATLGSIVADTAATNHPRLSSVAAIYLDTFASLAPIFDSWVSKVDPTHPLVLRLAGTMDTVQELFLRNNFRGALQQTHAVLSALPGEPDFPPIDVPPVPGSDD
jgi:hypothetical protein